MTIFLPTPYRPTGHCPNASMASPPLYPSPPNDWCRELMMMMIMMMMMLLCYIGSVYYIGDNDKITRPFTAEGAIKKLLYYDDKNLLVTITSTMMLTLHSVSGGGEARETLKVITTRLHYKRHLC